MWVAFGTDSLKGADFRACAALGPLYGKTRAWKFGFLAGNER